MTLHLAAPDGMTPEEREKALRREEDRLIRDQHLAEELLSNQLLVGAFEALEEHYFRLLRNFDPTKPEIAVAARLNLKAIDEVRQELRAVVNTGKMTGMQRAQREAVATQEGASDYETRG